MRAFWYFFGSFFIVCNFFELQPFHISKVNKRQMEAYACLILYLFILFFNPKKISKICESVSYI